ncbi:2-methylcitrate dehydratase [Rhodococcus sp. PAMC28707]|uniref:MmgE/PrpD family protein n=1 Tax=unclassified Rhodococcus (in: high G+C Gram-positive bacteria) TaxID=192944 RepID=UPI00109D8EDF|nr:MULTISPECIES: MmgE/PrpD family protein [unclassified Rhodococcus (in: high G+C Gram-positive bacteria)]QCB52074.1 2-methylcitrate dehydratase [Rhodococcus sp. PAMC28705]QCB59758.1 2-methylcitrate dehydratase [Rhodococcus sp. PAMC28707]
MTTDSMFLSAERSTASLARIVCELRDGDIPPELTERARSILLDLLGVTIAGARTNELRALSATWRLEEGKTRTLGSRIATTISAAAELDAIAACCLELDEGNKYAAGHPAAHVVPAAIAATRLSSTPVDGHTFLAAIVAGYEVAARFGHALTRDSRWHTHGHWGATGAAAAAASIWGADVDRVAAAIDSSAALIHVSPWGVVLEGNFARNLWIAGAVRAGLDAARLSEAALVDNSGALVHSLGDIVGTLDYPRLTEDLGTRWLTMEGYAKQHASCSYTHAAIDTVQSLRAHAPWNAEDVEQVRVRTHSLAAPLFQRHPTTRLGAMFSLPFAVAAAFVTDRIDTEALDPAGPVFTIAEEFSNRVDVTAATELDELLPGRRAAEVTVVLRSGEKISAMTPNPVGDVDHFPMDHAAIEAKIARLIGEDTAGKLATLIDLLPHTSDVELLLDTLQ